MLLSTGNTGNEHPYPSSLRAGGAKSRMKWLTFLRKRKTNKNLGCGYFFAQTVDLKGTSIL